MQGVFGGLRGYSLQLVNALRQNPAGFLRLYLPIFFATFLGSCLSAPLCLIGVWGKRAAHEVSRLWALACLRAAGIRVRVEGKRHYDPKQKKVLIANHRSYLDALILLVAIPGQFRFVATKGVSWIPFIGFFMKLQGHYFIDRGDTRSARALLLERVADDLRAHQALPPLIFPEGGFSRQSGRKQLHSGPFRLAQEVDLPVQSILIFGSRAALSEGELIPRRGSNALIHISPPEESSDHHKAIARRYARQFETVS